MSCRYAVFAVVAVFCFSSARSWANDLDVSWPPSRSAVRALIQAASDMPGESIVPFIQGQAVSLEVPDLVGFSPEHSPCPGRRCREVCVYEGAAKGKVDYPFFSWITLRGRVKVRTIYDNREQDVILRTILTTHVRALGQSARISVDEKSYFKLHGAGLRLLQMDLFSVTRFNADYRRPRWARTFVFWEDMEADFPELDGLDIPGDPAGSSHTRYFEIGAKDQDRFEGVTKEFAKKYLEEGAGSDWARDFFEPERAVPKRRDDKEIRDFPRSLLPALAVPFYHLRFAPLGASKYAAFVGKAGKKSPYYEMRFDASRTPGSSVRRVVGDIIIDKFGTRKDKPAVALINPETRSMESVTFSVADQKGTVSIDAQVRLQGCSIR